MKSLRITLLFLSSLLASCTQIQTTPVSPEDLFSTPQRKLVALAERYEMAKDNAANELAKSELRDHYLDSAKKLLIDSFKLLMPNFRVTVYDIDVANFQDQKAFVAKFYDNDGSGVQSVTKNEYWMEFDYPQDSVKKLEANPAYKLLRNIRVKSDTTLSFFCLGDVEWVDPSRAQFKIRVIPYPMNFNFDSSRKANIPKRR